MESLLAFMSKSFDNSLLPYHLCQPEIPKKLDSKWHSTYDDLKEESFHGWKLC